MHAEQTNHFPFHVREAQVSNIDNTRDSPYNVSIQLFTDPPLPFLAAPFRLHPLPIPSRITSDPSPRVRCDIYERLASRSQVNISAPDRGFRTSR